MAASSVDDEIEKTYVLEAFGSYAMLRQALTFIEAEIVEAFIDPAPADHGAFIAFDGISLGRNHRGEWGARVTVIAPQRFHDFCADAFRRYA